MAIQVGGTTVIDDDLNIVNVTDTTIGVITFYASSGNVATSGTVYAKGGVQAPVQVSCFVPINGATNVGFGTSIGVVFDQNIQRGTGTVTIREGALDGTLHSSYNVEDSSAIVIQGNELYLQPSSSLGVGTDVFLVMPVGSLKRDGTVLPDFAGINTTGGVSYSFTTQNQAFVSVIPAHDATGVGIGTSIQIFFLTEPVKGTGTINIRRDSATGTIVETYNAATNTTNISVAGTVYTITPSSDLPAEKDIYVEMPLNSIIGFNGFNVTDGDVNPYKFDTDVPLGTLSDDLGGYVVKKSGGRYDIIAAQCAEAQTNWYGRNGMLGPACTESGKTTGWYVPTSSQLQTIGFSCRAYWDDRPTNYWSNTDCSPAYAHAVNMATGSQFRGYKPFAVCGRAFRCVTY